MYRAQRTVQAPPRVLALYYGWYGTPALSKQWMHYENVDIASRKIGSHINTPLNGPYDSLDPQTLDRHARQARGAGIQTLVCSWWGKDDQTDRSFRALLPIAAGAGITICPMYERVTRPGDPASVIEDWRYLLAEYGKSPGFLRVDGAPVFFVYERARQQLTQEQWAEVLVAMESEVKGGVIAITDGADLGDALLFDGSFRLDPSVVYRNRAIAEVASLFQTYFTPVTSRASRFRRIGVVTVTPGHSENKLPEDATRVDRKKGAFYQAQWDQAAGQKGAWILINSFNQWHNGTELEPSSEQGDLYLQITQAMTTKLRSSSSAR